MSGEVLCKNLNTPLTKSSSYYLHCARLVCLLEVGIAFAVCSFPLMLDKIVQGESLEIAGIQKIYFSELLGH